MCSQEKVSVSTYNDKKDDENNQGKHYVFKSRVYTSYFSYILVQISVNKKLFSNVYIFVTYKEYLSFYYSISFIM